jgi:hypothetical protein
MIAVAPLPARPCNVAYEALSADDNASCPQGSMLLKSHMDRESSPVVVIQVGLRIVSNLRAPGFSRSRV